MFISNNLNLYSPNLENKNIKNQTSSLNKNLNQNLVKDKSQAVSEILGYGVDSEGYFTSDFNEKAGLPKDYKIYAKDIKTLLDSFFSFDLNMTFTELNSAKDYIRANKNIIID